MIYQSLTIIVIVAIFGMASGSTVSDPSSATALSSKNIQHISNPAFDCSNGADGCAGNAYCDSNDKGSCYDRNEGNDDGSSTNPESTTYKGSANPQPPLYK